MERNNSKEKNEKFAAVFDELWPKLASLFPLEVSEEIRLKVRERLLKSSAKQLNTLKVRSILIRQIADAAHVVYVQKKMRFDYGVMLEKIGKAIPKLLIQV